MIDKDLKVKHLMTAFQTFLGIFGALGVSVIIAQTVHNPLMHNAVGYLVTATVSIGLVVTSIAGILAMQFAKGLIIK